jgi:hypothetical protein
MRLTLPQRRREENQKDTVSPIVSQGAR